LISINFAGEIAIAAPRRRNGWQIDLSQGLVRAPAHACGQQRPNRFANIGKEVLRMKPRSNQAAPPADPDESPLTISPEKVCFIIIKAREFDAKDEVSEPDPGSNPSDDKDIGVLEDHEDDPVVEELTSFIDSLSEDEQIDLVALTWLGRDDYSADDWRTVREEAVRAHNQRTASYLLGTPMLGDFLEEGLSMLGYSCEEFEIERL
jgi:hypothetical protein